MDTGPCPSAPRFGCQALPPERFLITDVYLFDPLRGVDFVGDLLVAEGRIAALGPDLERPSGVKVLSDLAGCRVFPGLVDPHVHLRTPGLEYKEDLVSGPRAAAAGGYVTVVAMANTDPVVDRAAIASWVLEQAGRGAAVRVGQVGAVSKGLRGEELSEMWELAEAGAVAFSDDGRPVGRADLLLNALRYARNTGRPLLLHLEDPHLALDGVMHEGKWSARLGLHGIPATCESGPLARDLELVRYVHEEAGRSSGGARARAAGSVPLVHFQHISSVESVALLRRAKEEGLPVTAEATPHHLLLTDERLARFDPDLRVNPPIRSETDREALITALADGTIDCVGTDHAPHAPQEKEVPLEDALPGTIGLETAFAALYTGLVLTEKVSLARLIEVMSAAPCRLLGIEEPRLEVGAAADFFVADLEEVWEVTPASLRSKSRNCAFLGERLTGRVRLTTVEGARRFARARGEV